MPSRPTRPGRLAVSVLPLAVLLAAGPLLLAARPARAATTFTVTNVGDGEDRNLEDNVCDANPTPGVQCTLRAAIEQANRTAGADTIAFAIFGGGLHTIRPASGLPPINDTVTIDGYTQPGASPNTAAVGTNAALRIEIDGEATFDRNGLYVIADDSVIRGLVINRFDLAGVTVTDVAESVRVIGCFLGTNALGTIARGNGNGVEVGVGVEFTTIGGATSAARNLISGNALDGVSLRGARGGTAIEGNLIGTTAAGNAPLGNGDSGIDSNGTDDVAIGGGAAQANTIAFNGNDGVSIGAGAGNRILQNAIFSNGDLGIDLLPDGPTANDVGDGDTGSNNLQNKPRLTGATGTTVSGRLNSTPNGAFVVRIFSNPGGDQGRFFAGQVNVATNGAGDGAFTFSPNPPLPAGRTVTATATSATGDTSEFSFPRAVSA